MAGDRFIVLCAQIVGNMSNGFSIVYDWNYEFYNTRKAAIDAGYKERDSDDFNIGIVRDGRLVDIAWMNEPGKESPEVVQRVEDEIGLAEASDGR